MVSSEMDMLKRIKRGLVDLPLDSLKWLRFYFFRKVSDLQHASSREPLQELERNGVAWLNDILDRRSLDGLRSAMRDFDLEKALLNEGQATGRIVCQGLLDRRLKSAVEKFKVIAEAYLNSQRIKLELTYFQLSRPQSAINDVPGGSFHMDDNKPNIKFFVYLSDVGLLNGPFKVIPRSHGLNMKKIMRFIRWSLLKKRSDLYADKDLGLEAAGAIPILGDRGTCFAVDTTAWHMAEPVMSGQRKVFVASFNMI